LSYNYFFFLGATITLAILWFLNPEENYEPITLILGVVITLLSLIASKSSGFSFRNSEENYDIFISAPMAAFENNQKYEENRIFIIKLKQILKKECNLNVESHDNIPKIQPKIPRTFAQVKFFRCIILKIKKRFVFRRQQEPLYAYHPPPPFWGG
jgi:hypothetical protein